MYRAVAQYGRSACLRSVAAQCLRNVPVQFAIVAVAGSATGNTTLVGHRGLQHIAAVRFRGPEHGRRGVLVLQDSLRQIPGTKNKNGTPLIPGVHGTAAVRSRNPEHGRR